MSRESRTMPIEFWFEFASTYSYPAAMRIEALAASRVLGLIEHPPNRRARGVGLPFLRTRGPGAESVSRRPRYPGETLMLIPSIDLQDGHAVQLIGGEWVESAAGDTIEVLDPATGNCIATVAAAGTAEVDAASHLEAVCRATIGQSRADSKATMAAYHQDSLHPTASRWPVTRSPDPRRARVRSASAPGSTSRGPPAKWDTPLVRIHETLAI